ncbi:MAG: hypothetical protein AVDCRST_MAG86-4101, partial [uncultured Truepera sp.]
DGVQQGIWRSKAKAYGAPFSLACRGARRLQNRGGLDAAVRAWECCVPASCEPEPPGSGRAPLGSGRRRDPFGLQADPKGPREPLL